MSAALKLTARADPFDPTADPIAKAHEIVPVLLAEAPRIEVLGQLTPAVLDALHASGLYRTLLPRSLNGYGAGLEIFAKT